MKCKTNEQIIYSTNNFLSPLYLLSSPNLTKPNLRLTFNANWETHMMKPAKKALNGYESLMAIINIHCIDAMITNANENMSINFKVIFSLMESLYKSMDLYNWSCRVDIFMLWGGGLYMVFDSFIKQHTPKKKIYK